MLEFLSKHATEFSINLLAGIVGILIVLALERKRRPRLRMKIAAPVHLPPNDPLGRKECCWPVVEIHNEKIPWWLALVYDGDPAFACRAWISFHSPVDGGRIFVNEMPARWSEADQPRLAAQKGTDGKEYGVLENVQYAIDIPTGESMTVAPLYRAVDNESCYGWTNDSYLHGFQHPSWKLDKGRYIARIRAVTGGREFVDAFLVVNDAPFSDFRIEPVDSTVKRKLH